VAFFSSSSAFSSAEVDGEVEEVVKESGRRERTFALRFCSQGVRDDVDVAGGEGEVVVRSI
jgi:hypothetical protein